MKKLLIISLLIFVSINIIKAQRRTQTIKWFSIAAKAGVGNSVFLNTNILNDRNVEFDYLSLSQSYGGRFTFSYGENLGFGLEVLSSSYGQKYTVSSNNDTNIKKLKLKSLDILPFFRYTGSTGGYIELGAKISNVKSLTETNSNSLAIVRNDLPIYYEPSFTSAVLGFGLALYKGERVDVNLGARFSYALKDIVTPNTNFQILDDTFYTTNYSNIATTNPISAQAVLEVNYYFGFYGDARCGNGRLMLFQ